MKKILLAVPVFMLTWSLAFGAPSAPVPTEAEALFVRRIVELWKGGDFDLAKQQLHQFLEEYPKSPFLDRLMCVSGDYEWSQGHYADATRFYSQISGKQFLEPVLDRFSESLYRTGQYAQLEGLLKDGLPSADLEELTDADAARLFYYAEALSHSDGDMPGAYTAALLYYKRLEKTALASEAQLGIASTLVKLRRPDDAVDLYLAIADEFPDKREALILRAAQIQTEYNPEAAVETLRRLNGQKTEGGAFSQVFLLFNAGRHQELLDQRTELLSAVLPDQKPLIEFFMGRAAFALGRYQEAMDWLKPLLEENSVVASSPSNEKIVLFTLIASAQQLHQAEVAVPWLRRFEEHFPNDVMANRLQLSQAILMRVNGNAQDALALIERIVDKLPLPEDSEKAAFQRIAILHDLERCRDCYQNSQAFLATYPDSIYKSPLKKLMVQMTVKQLQEPSLATEERIVLQERLSESISELLRNREMLLPSEIATYQLQLAKAEYAQQHFHGAMIAARQFLDDYPKDKDAYQAHLILAYCYFENGSLQPFAEHAELALSLKPDLADQDVIHQNLFGAYHKLSRAAGHDSQEEESYNAKAADHLFAVIEGGATSVKPEALHWLAHYYYDQVRGAGSDHNIQPLPPSKRRQVAHRAAQALQTVVARSISIEPERLRDYLMLSRLYGWLGLEDQRRVLLEQTLAKQWPDTRETRQQISHIRLALAQRYEFAGDSKKALTVYENLVNGSGENDPYVRDAAQLQIARLRFLALSEPQRRLDNPEVVLILNTLQGLQTRRNLAHEPVHLEAAWECAVISAALVGPVTRDDVLLSNLKQTKREIVAQDDIVSRDYHAGRHSHVDRDQIYQAYLMLFDARIAQLEAQQAASRQRFQEQRSKLAAAETLYNALIQGDFAVSDYLVSQANKGLDEIATARAL